MYTVKVVVQPSDPKKPERVYRKNVYEGIFCGKPDVEISINEIKKKCSEYVLNLLKEADKNIELTATVSVKKLPDDFIFIDGKNI
jgi:hypothetical protein